jgi:chaperonin cofactor prefoldin
VLHGRTPPDVNEPVATDEDSLWSRLDTLEHRLDDINERLDEIRAAVASVLERLQSDR